VTSEDLVRLKSRIKSINHTADIIETQNSVVDLNKILNISSFDIEAVLKLEPDFLENQEH
jgi:G3E family GTPase